MLTHLHLLDKGFANWDADNYDWLLHSYTLPMFYHDYFDKWWCKYKYNWEYDSWALAKYCHDNFEKWWSPYLFNWEDSYAVVCLCQYCSQYVDKWFLTELFNWEYGFLALAKYCPSYFEKHINPSILVSKVSKEGKIFSR